MVATPQLLASATDARRRLGKGRTGMHELKIVREHRAGYGTLRRFRSSMDVWLAFQQHFEQGDCEEWVVLLLDAKNGMLDFTVLSVGSLTRSIVHPREGCEPVAVHNDAIKEQYNEKDMTREICEAIVRRSAAAIILMQNHLSGDPHPSQEDLAITRRIREIGEMLGVRVLDHIIFGTNTYISFVDDNYWDK
jgi:DNA repair protein RadC